MDEYKIIEHIGDGAHGHVLKGYNIKRKEEVALKKIRFKKQDNEIPVSVLREIKILLIVKSKYIVELRDYFSHDYSVVLVFEFMPSGLWEILHDSDNPPIITHIKCYMRMLLKGVSYLHENGIMHRMLFHLQDLKPANLLISSEGTLKIADLGLSRMMWSSKEGDRPYTHQVATRWYRAPELLYGSRHYDQSVDLWAVGCIFAEMIKKSPLFPGENDIEQLAMVLHNLGTPTEESWPGLHQLPDYNKISFSHSEPKKFEELIPGADSICVDLIESFIRYDGKKRLSAGGVSPDHQALSHQYFYTWPLPCQENEMPIPDPEYRKVIKSQLEDEGSNQKFFEDFNTSLNF